MGLLNKLFGGGTKLELTLDATQAPAGGILAGRLTLHGGKKALTLTALTLRLQYILVRSKEGSSLPEIDTRTVLEHTLAQGESIPAESTRDFDFRFKLPDDLDPSGDGVSYKILAAADIPKVADPTAEATLKIVEGAGGGLSLEECYERWPDLRSHDEDDLCEALHEVNLACYEERDELQVLEPILAGMIRTGSADVRKRALETWANLLDGRARKEHIKLLHELAGQRTLDRDFLREVITAAAKFAEEGALPLIKELARSPDPEVREEVATQLRFAAEDKFRGKLAVLESMLGDSVPAVRAAVVSAFSDFRDNKKLMKAVAQLAESDPSDEVQAACISTLSLCHHYGLGDLTLEVYRRHLQSPSARVRKEIGQNLQWLDEDEAAAVAGLAERLLADDDQEVRRSTAWNFVNLGEFPGLAPLIRRVADNDPDPEVRADALFGMCSVVPLGELIPLYRQRLANDPSSQTAWAVLGGARHQSEEPEARAFLQELTRWPMDDIAQAARDALE
ncbi:MAG: HEAT repeat domain-containing protein [Myxococcales bacterium]|nr:HEAT repeat domain-containing protein [Myxococcales bacterium]